MYPLRVYWYEDFLRLKVIFALAICWLTTAYSQAQSCQKVHGRARFYSGDGQLRIWHIGTHHEFAIYDDPSSDMLLEYLCSPKLGCTLEAPAKSLFADFTLCPTEKFKLGAAQPAIVKAIKQPVVVPWNRDHPAN